MKFSIVAVVLPLIAGTSAAPAAAGVTPKRDLWSPACAPYTAIASNPYPNDNQWGPYSLCCNYNGPDPGTYQNCCDRNGDGTGSGFPGCVKV